MNPVMLTVECQLGENRGHLPMQRGVANVILASGFCGCVDNEFAGFAVILSNCFNIPDIRAVAKLGHGEASGQLQSSGICQIFLVMKLGPQVQNTAAKQTKLYAKFDRKT